MAPVSDGVGTRNKDRLRTSDNVLESFPTDDGMRLGKHRGSTVSIALLGPGQKSGLLRDTLYKADAERSVPRVDEGNVVGCRLVDVVDYQAQRFPQGREQGLGSAGRLPVEE